MWQCNQDCFQSSAPHTTSATQPPASWYSAIPILLQRKRCAVGEKTCPSLLDLETGSRFCYNKLSQNSWLWRSANVSGWSLTYVSPQRGKALLQVALNDTRNSPRTPSVCLNCCPLSLVKLYKYLRSSQQNR